MISSATNVVTSPIPPISAGALSIAVFATNGPSNPPIDREDHDDSDERHRVELHPVEDRGRDDEPDSSGGDGNRRSDQEPDHAARLATPQFCDASSIEWREWR